MALKIIPSILMRCINITSRKYCDGKSIYQREEEGKKPRTVYGQEYPEWRKQWTKRDGEWTSKLSLFNEKNPNPDILNALSKLPYLSVEQVKNWWHDMKIIQEVQNQKYLAERTVALGSNLAAVHFFTYRQAAVRLKDSKHWLYGDITKLNLPNTYVDGYFVEAVDCTNFHYNGIRYEGLQNLMGLNFLKWLSLKNSKYIDEWCLDRIAGQNGQTLQYLDITGCKLNAGGVHALARMRALNYLIISDPGENLEVQAALSMLEEENPDLWIKVVTVESCE